MLAIINDLYRLSDNSPLFDNLRTGGDLAALTTRVAESAGVPSRTARTELLLALRDALVAALQSRECSGLEKLIEDADVNARVVILGELILTLRALKEGNHSGEKADAILDRTFQLARDLAQAIEAMSPQDTADAELLAHGIAMREWAHLLADYYQDAGMTLHAGEMLMIRARVTNCTLSSWPHLVGSAMVDVALALEAIGNVDLAARCFNGVRMDLRYLIDRIDDPAFPEFEKVAAIFWLQRACEGFCRLVPGDADAARELQIVRDLRRERSYPDMVSAPRFGPIARTYLAATPYLALIIRALEEGYDPDRHSETVAAICKRFGCPSRDVDFYLSAMGSYQVRNTILRGARMFYDDAHEEVFAAIDYLRGRSDGEESAGA